MDHAATCGFHCVYDSDHVSTPFPAYNPPESHLTSPVSLEEAYRFDSSISLVACLFRLVSLILPPWYPYFPLSHPVLCVAVEHFGAPWSHSVLPILVSLTFPVLSNIMLR